MIPSSLFLEVVGEKNYSFLNYESVFFVSICLFSLWLGMKAFYLLPKKKAIYVKRPSSGFIFWLLVFCCIVNALVTFNIYINNKSMLLSIFVFGESAKALLTDANLDGTFSSITVPISSLCLWCYYHSDKILSKKKIIGALVFLSFLVSLIKPLLFMNRLGIMSSLSAYAAIFMYHRYKKGQNKRVVVYAIGLALLVIAIFISISFMRVTANAADTSILLKNLFGYTVVPYSHLGALLSSKLNYYSPGFGYYIFTFLRDTPLIGSSIEKFLGWSDGYYNWLREFQDSWRAGLNGDLIWLSSFGYVFVSMGWFSFIFFYFLGMFSSATWRGFINGTDFGIIFYPWIYFCLLFLFGTNVIATKNTLLLVLSFVLIKVLNIFLKKDVLNNDR